MSRRAVPNSPEANSPEPGRPQPSPPGRTLLRVEGFTAPHGFSTRKGGHSSGPYTSLNLGASTADDPDAVKQNQRLLAGLLGVEPSSVAGLRQVHGRRVVEARAGEPQEADAQVSDDPALLLVIGSADCFPLLFHHPPSGAVAAAHCGWRGTVAGLAGETVQALAGCYGCEPSEIEVAIGPGICPTCYQVGADVMERFRAAGFSDEVATPDDEGGWRLDLVAANRRVLEQAGVAPEAIVGAERCTSCEPDLFYSHRRDSGVTGRHWAAVRATSGG